MHISELPFGLSILLTLGITCLLSVVGLYVVKKVLKVKELENEGVKIGSTVVSIIGALYGLVLALLVINLWKDYVDLSAKTVEEATQIDILYREAGNLKELQKKQLRSLIQNYLKIIISDSWPQMQDGIESNKAILFYNELDAYVLNLDDKDVAQGEKSVIKDLVSGLNELSKYRKERLFYASTARIPSRMWYVITIGAILSIASTYFFKVGTFKLQMIFTIMHSTMIGVIIFLIISLDYPFKGGIQIEPFAFKKTLELIGQKERNM